MTRRAWRLVAGAIVCATLVLALLAVPAIRHAIGGAQPRSWQIAEAAFFYDIDTDHSLRITMPDGAVLAASLYLPQDRQGPLPTVLVRLPYGRLSYGEGYAAGLFFARQGYASLVQDLRGTGDSDGELLPWQHAADDGVATLDWITRQPWSNGKVGTFGCSALGETQLVLGTRNHPAHLAIIASGAGGAIGSLEGRYGYFGLFEGGVLQLASGFGWYVDNGTKSPHAAPARPYETAQVLRQLPLSQLVAGVRPAPNGYTELLATPLGDPQWDRWGYLTDAERIEIPALIINSWNDQTVGDALAIAEHQRRNVPAAARDQRVVIAPGAHCHHEAADTDPAFGALASHGTGKPMRELYLRWFDRWLRGQGPGLADFRAYTYFMLDENRWYEADQWPPAAATAQRWLLDSGGRANSRGGDGVLTLTTPARTGTDSFAYDPAKPVPTRGGPACCTGDLRDVAGTVDQGDVEMRDDVLVYTSEALADDLRIAGPLKATLTISSDAPDTDLVARLVDVLPDGRALNIQEGALRLRYREGVPPRLMQPGTLYRVTVDMRSIAYRVAKGHRLRLDVTSSSFPRLERNLNTGRDNYRETELRVATNNLHHGPEQESWLELPVLGPVP